MMFVDYILQWARAHGYTAVYGSPEQVNEMLTSVPFADSKDGTAVIMHLVADSETYNGHDRAIVAVYFASLCQFDFSGESLLPEQERLKNVGKDMLNYIRSGNVLNYEYPRWQYGYDDYSENVCWVCLRVTLTALAADCVPLPIPPPMEIVPVTAAAATMVTEAVSEETQVSVRGDVIAEGRDPENDYINIAFVFSTRDEIAGTPNVTLTLNGVEHSWGVCVPDVVTEETLEDYPELAPYLGWYVWSNFFSELQDETDLFCAKIEIEGVWSSGEVCWEEGI